MKDEERVGAAGCWVDDEGVERRRAAREVDIRDGADWGTQGRVWVEGFARKKIGWGGRFGSSTSFVRISDRPKDDEGGS